jgi:hypothetical protein
VALQVGERAPDLIFVGPNGGEVPLAGYFGRPLLMVFLRHLA